MGVPCIRATSRARLAARRRARPTARENSLCLGLRDLAFLVRAPASAMRRAGVLRGRFGMPRRSLRRRGPKPLVALHDRHDVAVGVLEPGGLRATPGKDAVLGPFVFLELHAAALQIGHFALDVVLLPERLARLGGAGVGSRVQEACGAVGEFVDHPAGGLAFGLEAELLLVELPRAGDVLHRYVRVHGSVLEHCRVSLGLETQTAAAAREPIVDRRAAESTPSVTFFAAASCLRRYR